MNRADNRPENIEVVDGNNVALTWADRSDNEDGFKIYRAKKIRGKYIYNSPIDSVTSNIIEYIDAVSETGDYRYKILAFNGSTESDFSNEVSVKVETIFTPEPGTLAAPVLSASASTLSVTLNWTHDCPSDTTCTYNIERGDAKVRGKINFISTTNNESPVTIEEANTGTYYYRINATTESGESAYSNTVSVRLK